MNNELKAKLTLAADALNLLSSQQLKHEDIVNMVSEIIQKSISSLEVESIDGELNIKSPEQKDLCRLFNSVSFELKNNEAISNEKIIKDYVKALSETANKEFGEDNEIAKSLNYILKIL